MDKKEATEADGSMINNLEMILKFKDIIIKILTSENLRCKQEEATEEGVAILWIDHNKTLFKIDQTEEEANFKEEETFKIEKTLPEEKILAAETTLEEEEVISQ